MRTTVLFLFALVVSLSANAFQVDGFQDRYIDLVDKTFNKNEAYSTVAFVEKYFRVVGNEGFDASIYHVAKKLEKAGL